MQTDDFEAAFSAFLDRREYDELVQCLFTFVRAAFLAGWKAAGGEGARTAAAPAAARKREAAFRRLGNTFVLCGFSSMKN